MSASLDADDGYEYTPHNAFDVDDFCSRPARLPPDAFDIDDDYTPPDSLDPDHFAAPSAAAHLRFRVENVAAAARHYARRARAYADDRFVYGLFPLIHTLLLVAEMAAIASIARRYDVYFEKRPIVTMMVTNSILNGIADTVAQTVTAVKSRAAHRTLAETMRADGGGGGHRLEKLAAEVDGELERLPHYGDELVPDVPRRAAGFDFARFGRFAAWGFLMAPVSFKWYQFLGRALPIAGGHGTAQALKRVALDQLIMAPVGTSLFFTYMTLAEGGGAQDVRRKFDHVYVPTMKANYMLWPAVQLLNFRVMPLQLQLPFASTVGIAWGTYLSLTNSSSDQ